MWECADRFCSFFVSRKYQTELSGGGSRACCTRGTSDCIIGRIERIESAQYRALAFAFQFPCCSSFALYKVSRSGTLEWHFSVSYPNEHAIIDEQETTFEELTVWYHFGSTFLNLILLLFLFSLFFTFYTTNISFTKISHILIQLIIINFCIFFIFFGLSNCFSLWKCEQFLYSNSIVRYFNL